MGIELKIRITFILCFVADKIVLNIRYQPYKTHIELTLDTLRLVSKQ